MLNVMHSIAGKNEKRKIQEVLNIITPENATRGAFVRGVTLYLTLLLANPRFAGHARLMFDFFASEFG